MYNLYQKKLIKEIEFLNADYEYLSDKISETDQLFLEEVDVLLNKYPDLKDIYKENSVNNYVISESNGEYFDDKSIPKNNKIKKLYRQIVKETHPDKVSDDKLNQYYIEATENYDSNNVSILYSISEKLNIKYEMSKDDEDLLLEEIKILKKKIGFLETTFTWKWYNSDNNKEKNRIILKYIKSKIEN